MSTTITRRLSIASTRAMSASSCCTNKYVDLQIPVLIDWLPGGAVAAAASACHAQSCAHAVGGRSVA